MSHTNHNGGPPSTTLTSRVKIEILKRLLTRTDLSTVEKLIGIALIANANADWASEVTTSELQVAASVKDRETVFRATRALDAKAVVAKASGRGQAGRYSVLPPAIVDAVVGAYEAKKSGRVKADQSDGNRSGETGRHKQPGAVGFEPTSPVKPVGFKPTSQNRSGETGRVQADQSRAEVSNNIYNNPLIDNNNINNIYNNTPTASAREPNTREGYDALSKTLLDACNGALDNHVNCQGLTSLAIPLMWLREGCDLERDVIPTLLGFGVSHHGKRIKSWKFFTDAVQDARDARVSGMSAATPTQRQRRAASKSSGAFFGDELTRELEKIDQEQRSNRK